VLLVRPEAAAERGVAPLRRLLVTVDGTAATASAMRPATEFARRLGAALDVLYVDSPEAPATGEPGTIGAPRYVDQPHHEWPAWRGRMRDHLSACIGGPASELPVQAFSTVADIAADITRFATARQSDAVVLVRRSQLETGRARILRTVLDRMPCPVLLVASRLPLRAVAGGSMTTPGGVAELVDVSDTTGIEVNQRSLDEIQ
jgi:nucleotide-binding universal stress UspA family protein